MTDEIAGIKRVLSQLRDKGKVKVALLYGSHAKGKPHKRSDIDLAIFMTPGSSEEEIEIVDEILMAAETPVSILRLDDEEESPFVVQEALKGIHLVKPDLETLYRVHHQVLHEAEGIRFRRELSAK